MPAPVPITRPKLLVVEGWNERAFYYELARHLGMGETLQVQTFEGNPALGAFLRQLPKVSGFREMVQSLGVIRDAESDATAAWASVCRALGTAGLSVPAHPGEFTATRPRVGAYIQPGRGRAGALEDLLMEAVAGDQAFSCIEPFVKCAEGLSVAPKNSMKTRAQAFLASRKEAGLSIGKATQKGYWNLDHAAYDEVRAFLKAL